MCCSVTIEQVKEIATIKMVYKYDNMDKAILIISGTAKSMGIKVIS
jgi:ribosomal protein L11